MGDTNEETPAESAGAERIKTPVSYFFNEGNYFDSLVLFIRHEAAKNRLTVAINLLVVYKARPEPHDEVRLIVFDGVENLARGYEYIRRGLPKLDPTELDLPPKHSGSPSINYISAATYLNAFNGWVAVSSWGVYQFRFQSVTVRARYLTPLGKERQGEKLYRDLDTSEVKSFADFMDDEYQT